MRRRILAWVLLAGAACAAAPSFAQSSGLENRVGRLESEMRAVQRKVFPGGGGQYLEPEIKPASPGDTPGSPSGSPLSDLTARVDAVESQLTGITGQIETAQHRVQVLEDAFNAYKRSTDARLKALEDTAASTAGTGTPAPIASDDTPPPPARGGGRGTGVKQPATRPTKTADTDGVTPPTTDPARQQQLAAIERPQSGDAGEDAYLYGYRLWQAKLYPEAEAQFKLVTATYPKHRRASYAQNLLGRSYLEDGKPSLASLAFYDNYKKWPDGERAPDSLYYLGQSLVKLGKPAADVCKVYRELEDVYGAKLSDAMKADVTRAKAQSKCG